MLDFLTEHYPALAGGILGLLLLFWPPPSHAAQEERRQNRLAELRGGADERYFEEQRELEAYGPSSAGRSACGLVDTDPEWRAAAPLNARNGCVQCPTRSDE